MTAGLPEDEAEHEAVRKFGSPALAARNLRAALASGRLNRAASAAWLLAGIAVCGLGAGYLLVAWWHTWQIPACTIVLSAGCYTTGTLVMRITTAATIAGAGVLLLFGHWLAVRYAALASSRRTLALRSRR